MRAIIDTNVLVSGLLWHNAPHSLLEHVRDGVLSMAISPALLAELADVIGRPKFDSILVHSNTSRSRTLDELRRLAEVIEPPPLPQPVCRDPDDDAVLACALAAKADLIVSGDRDLLDLNEHQGVRIVTAAQAPRSKKTRDKGDGNKK